MKKIIVMGNLVGDAEVKGLESGDKVMNFTVAVNSDYKKQNGEKVTRVDYFDCFQFRKTGEFGIAPHLIKGKKIVVEGAPEVRAYINNAGDPVGQMKINIREIHFAGGSSKDALADQPNANEYKAAQEDDLPF